MHCRHMPGRYDLSLIGGCLVKPVKIALHLASEEILAVSKWIVKHCLQEERSQNQAIMDNLDRERQAALAEQQRALAEHVAELDAERQRQADLAERLSATQVTAKSCFALPSNV